MAKSQPKKRRDQNQLAKSIVNQATGDAPAEPVSDGKDPAAVSLGRRGGLKGGPALAKSLNAKKRAEIAKKAAAARWNKTI
jgi:hypothetical protein